MAGISDYMDIAKLQAQQQATDLANQQLQNALKERESFGYSLASALSALPQQQGYGNWGNAALNAFGNAFNARINNAIDRAQQNYKSLSGQQQADLAAALKFAQASSADDVRKYQIAQAAQAKAEKEQEKQNLIDSAQASVDELADLANSGVITKLNNKTGFWTGSDSAKNIGRRESALSALLPMTNAIARASGGSGINTVGEMMAYLGIPENATSAQIAGALPMVAKKLGLNYSAPQDNAKQTQPAQQEQPQGGGRDFSKYGF